MVRLLEMLAQRLAPTPDHRADQRLINHLELRLPCNGVAPLNYYAVREGLTNHDDDTPDRSPPN